MRIGVSINRFFLLSLARLPLLLSLLLLFVLLRPNIIKRHPLVYYTRRCFPEFVFLKNPFLCIRFFPEVVFLKNPFRKNDDIRLTLFIGYSNWVQE